MSKSKSQPFAAHFFKELSGSLSSARVRGLAKQVVKTSDLSVLLAIPYAISQHIAPKQRKLNILIDQVATKEIIDHGRWLALIPFIVKRDIELNITIINDEAIESQQSHHRPFIDYLIEKELKAD